MKSGFSTRFPSQISASAGRRAMSAHVFNECSHYPYRSIAALKVGFRERREKLAGHALPRRSFFIGIVGAGLNGFTGLTGSTDSSRAGASCLDPGAPESVTAGHREPYDHQ